MAQEEIHDVLDVKDEDIANDGIKINKSNTKLELKKWQISIC